MTDPDYDMTQSVILNFFTRHSKYLYGNFSEVIDVKRKVRFLRSRIIVTVLRISNSDCLQNVNVNVL